MYDEVPYFTSNKIYFKMIRRGIHSLVRNNPFFRTNFYYSGKNYFSTEKEKESEHKSEGKFHEIQNNS